MNRVKAIKSMDEVYGFYNQLGMSHWKYQILFLIGVETGLRISDVLRMTVSGAREPIWHIRESKTTKERHIEPSMALQIALRAYMTAKELQDDEYLIYSREKDRGLPVSREQAYKTFKKAARLSGLDSVGTHTMRKTFAVHHYRKHHDLEKLREILNHERVETTLIYLADCLG